MKLGIAEILNKVRIAKTTSEKVAVLQTYDNNVLLQMVALNYDPTVEWSIPEGTPPFKPSPALDSQSIFYGESRRLYLFLKGPQSPDLTDANREKLWIQLLESLDAQDAKVLLSVRNRNLETDYKVSKEVVQLAWPTIKFPEGDSNQKSTKTEGNNEKLVPTKTRKIAEKTKVSKKPTSTKKTNKSKTSKKGKG